MKVTENPWKVTSNPVGDKCIYGVYRFIDPDEQEAIALAARLNEEEKEKSPDMSRTNLIDTYSIPSPLGRSQVPRYARRPGSPIKPGDAEFESCPALHLISERRGQVLNTYQIRYKQFPRSRRSIHTIHIEADSIQNARIEFLKAINLAKKLQHHTPFWCDHITIIDIWEVASDG